MPKGVWENRVIMMISRRVKIFQMTLIFLIVLFTTASAFAANKDEAVTLAHDIMQVTIKTQKDETADPYEPYNLSLIHI